jgi:hypothetical protein
VLQIDGGSSSPSGFAAGVMLILKEVKDDTNSPWQCHRLPRLGFREAMYRSQTPWT